MNLIERTGELLTEFDCLLWNLIMDAVIVRSGGMLMLALHRHTISANNIAYRNKMYPLSD